MEPVAEGASKRATERRPLRSLLGRHLRLTSLAFTAVCPLNAKVGVFVPALLDYGKSPRCRHSRVTIAISQIFLKTEVGVLFQGYSCKLSCETVYVMIDCDYLLEAELNDIDPTLLRVLEMPRWRHFRVTGTVFQKRFGTELAFLYQAYSSKLFDTLYGRVGDREVGRHILPWDQPMEKKTKESCISNFLKISEF